MDLHDRHRRRRLEDEQTDDALGPGRADFRKAGDDDIPRPWLVTVPVLAVADAIFDSPERSARKHVFPLFVRGDWKASVYAKAAKLGPDMLSGYYSWGVALAKHDDLAGAAAKFATANKVGPHWADPWPGATCSCGSANSSRSRQPRLDALRPLDQRAREQFRILSVHCMAHGGEGPVG